MNYKVIITKKNIKNLILKIKKDGNLYISAPFQMEEKYIHNFILKKEKWIIRKLKEQSEKANIHSPSYLNNSSIFYLGVSHTLILKLESFNKISLEGTKIIVSSINPKDKVLTKNILDDWYKEQAKYLFEKLLNKYLILTNNKINKLNIKTLKSNWGSCNHRKKIINLNSELMKKDIQFIEYVILHEIAHLVHNNHSKKFYSYINFFMPDWKKRKSL